MKYINKSLEGLCEKHFNGVHRWVEDRLKKDIKMFETVVEGGRRSDKRLSSLLKAAEDDPSINRIKGESDDQRKIRLSSLFLDINQFCTSYMKEILTADRNEMIQIWKDFKYFFETEHNTNAVSKCISYYMDFKRFKEDKFYNNSSFVSAVDLRVCPYCNRQYSIGITKGSSKLITPQLDHYFPKSKYPLFAISFYNLIPSCGYCNQLKNDFDAMESPHFHPYQDKVEPYFKITCVGDKISKDVSKYSFKLLSKNEDILKHSESAFHLSKFYEKHDFELQKVVEQFLAYPPEYIEDLEKYTLSQGIKGRKLEHDIFNVVKEGEHGITPLDKFRSDLYSSLKKLHLESVKLVDPEELKGNT